MTVDQQLARRADGQANRARLLETARKAFAADPATSLNSIAKLARVGPGTLYRHFASREALLVGVYRQEIDELVALAATLLQEHPPLEAFRRWCDRFAAFGDIKHGVADTLIAALSDQQARETYEALLGTTRDLLQACAEAGAVRGGIPPGDVLALMSTLLRVAPTTEGKAQRKRLISLIVASLAVPVSFTTQPEGMAR